MTEATENVVVPDIGDADGVEVIEFCLQPGDAVAVDNAVLVIESDKASMEIQSTVAGVLASFKVALGDVVTTDQIVAEITTVEVVAEESVAEKTPTSTVADAAATSAPAESAAELEVRLPDIGDAGEVVVIELGAAEGETVSAEQMLLVVESDKASMDIVAPVDGVLLRLAVSEGDSVGEDALLAVMSAVGVASSKAPAASDREPAASDKEPAASDKAPAATDKESAASDREPAATVEAPAAVGDEPEVRAAPAPVRHSSGLAPPPTPTAAPAKSHAIYAGPAVRRMARELGVNLLQVTGTGARGRIVKDDVSLFVKTALANGGANDGASEAAGSGIPQIPEIDFARYGEITLEPMSRIMRRGASNLHRSWLNVVHVTQHDEADITDLEDFRRGLKPEGERRGTKITPLAFIAKACAFMLAQHPKFNCSLDSKIENLIMKSYINIGFAVDTPDGLLVPVVRDADKKGVWELAAEINELAAKARNKKLTPNDLQGGTFSISSLGNLGGTGFTPIVNAPEVAILGVAKLATKPHWNGTEFVPRKMLPLSLSYDHRAINGAQAGRFVTELAAVLADMRRVML